jgi:hypothetical protein
MQRQIIITYNPIWIIIFTALSTICVLGGAYYFIHDIYSELIQLKLEYASKIDILDAKIADFENKMQEFKNSAPIVNTINTTNDGSTISVEFKRDLLKYTAIALGIAVLIGLGYWGVSYTSYLIGNTFPAKLMTMTNAYLLNLLNPKGGTVYEYLDQSTQYMIKVIIYENKHIELWIKLPEENTYKTLARVLEISGNRITDISTTIAANSTDLTHLTSLNWGVS